MNRADQYTQSLTHHYSRQFGAAETLHWPHGPTHQVPNDFHVLRFAPSSSRLFCFATCGMAARTNDASIECFLLSPVPDVSQVELLTVLAWYHTTTARLGVGHTVNFGRAWMPDSECTHGLLSVPYLHGPSLEWFEHANVRSHILWLIPITPEERAFKVSRGLDALESRFESPGFDYANPHRASVIASNESTGIA